MKAFPQRQPVRFASRMERPGRGFGRPEGPKMQREIEIDVSKDIQVFSNKRFRFFNTIIFVGVTQTVLWGYLAYFSFQFLQDEASLEPRTGWRDSWLFKNKYRVSVCLVCCLAAVAACVFSLSYPIRSIKQMWLLKGGENIRLETFSPMSLGEYSKKVIKVPLKDISGQLARVPTNNTIPIKVKGYRFHFLMDNKSGVFHEPNLYDYTIGLRRNLK
ncbi:hypothetical protein FSP39_007541 [Pinctada imbricata]|uniref:Transmembrane protein 223 n=1 Tax=Pinctada imbricata TaxID=66713 RepID=A0AA88Y2S2_PINIB|nr:hypothetical protein FSP39_007541 [Pinctada imbricata]